MIESRFVGGLSSYIMYRLLAMLITAVTFGICAPWGIVLMYRWKIENMIINYHLRHLCFLVKYQARKMES